MEHRKASPARAGLWWAGGVGSGRWGTEFRSKAWSCRAGDPVPTLPQIRLRKLRHLLHGDGVEKPGIEALGKKERKCEKTQRWGI